MGGHLNVDTEPGQGSTFTVTIPLADLPAVADTPASPSGELPAVQTTTSTLVYIEDNSTNMKLVTRIMELRPVWVMSSSGTGEGGLEAIRTTKPTAVLLDLHLRGMGGIDVLRALKADPATADIPVAIVSGDASPKQIERALAAGAELYLTKPFQIDDLIAFLDAHML
jgi:CheY-like chemotaxis protein